MEECGVNPTKPGELADEENDPHHHHHHRPSLPPAVKMCIKECLEKHKPSKLPTEPDKENDPRRPRPSGVSPRPPCPSGVSPRPRPRPPRHILRKCIKKCHGEMKPTTPGELADEENDPHHRPRPSFSPEMKKCIHECLEKHKPSRRPPPSTEPGKIADV